jgi:dipeptidase E
MKIVAIGGGENGRPGKPYEIKKFDEEIVKMTNLSNPNFLFIAFTQSSAEGAEDYYNIINRNFTNLGCICEHLREKDLQDMNIINKKITEANIIYVGGGNTLRLMNILRKYHIDEMLRSVGEKGTILCGISAGAICWHNFGNSDSRKFTSNSNKLIKVTGLGFIPALYCPHYDNESARQEDLKRMMKTTKGVALAFESCSALKIIENKYWVLKTKESAKAWKCYWYKGKYIKTELPTTGEVDCLITKN